MSWQCGSQEKANPSSDVLQNLAQALNTTTNYLMNESTDEMASSQLHDMELLNLFKSVEQLGGEDKNMIKTFLYALISKRKVKSLA